MIHNNPKTDIEKRLHAAKDEFDLCNIIKDIIPNTRVTVKQKIYSRPGNRSTIANGPILVLNDIEIHSKLFEGIKETAIIYYHLYLRDGKEKKSK